MLIELRRLSDIRPYERNPRRNDHAVKAVAESIREYGWRQPIVTDEEGIIIVGHTRYKAALLLGLNEAPVHVARGFTPAQVKAYRLADNKTAELATWDEERLIEELLELQKQEIDLDLTGFSASELLRLFHSRPDAGFTDPDAIPEPPDAAVTQPGQLWLLGNHRLLCGDASKPEDVDRLVNGEPVHLVHTDPPYGVKVEPRSNNAIAAGLSSFDATHHQGFDVNRHLGKSKATSRKLRPKDRPLANDFLPADEFAKLLHLWFGNIARVLLPGRSFYVWGGYANCANYPGALAAAELYFSQAVIWDNHQAS